MRTLTLYEAVRDGVGVERPCLCPVHADTRPSASVNVVKKVWYCYTCKAHGDLEGEVLAGDPDFVLVAEHLRGIIAEPRIYPESWLNRFDAAGPGEYWLSRFTPEACRTFRLGQDENGMATYPLRAPDGAVLGVVKRSGMKKGPKYLYPRGIDIGTLLFNFSWSWIPTTLVLVEGAADAIAVWEAGFDAIAIYGSKFSDHQTELIRALDPDLIVCAFDMDDAGWGAYQDVRRQFLRVARATWPRSEGDIADMSISRRRKIIEGVAYGEPLRIGSQACSSTPTQTLSPAIGRPSWPPRRRTQS